MAGADETRFEREQINVCDRRLTHAGRLNLQHSAIGKETTNFRHNCRAF